MPTAMAIMAFTNAFKAGKLLDVIIDIYFLIGYT